MQLIRFSRGGQVGLAAVVEGRGYDLAGMNDPRFASLSALLTCDTPVGELEQTIADWVAQAEPEFDGKTLVEQGRLEKDGKEWLLLPPIDQQEVWASGVTYKRSEEARKAESEGAALFYAKVYDAARPELFFKATPHRTVGHRDAVGIRFDARWNVPEPELGLVLTRDLEILGYTVGNDMSSRDIEGENPLYLPQAKVYERACAVGPGIALAGSVGDPKSLTIRLTIERDGEKVFEGETGIDAMKREFSDLIQYLGRANAFPHGAILLTGTGIVPDDSFTLQQGDVVTISVDRVGALVNPVVVVGG